MAIQQSTTTDGKESTIEHLRQEHRAGDVARVAASFRSLDADDIDSLQKVDMKDDGDDQRQRAIKCYAGSHRITPANVSMESLALLSAVVSFRLK